MEQDTEKVINEQFRALPGHIQRAITLTPWRNILSRIVSEENLDADKLESLQTEVMLVLYGFENQSNLANNIATELSVSPEVAEKLVDRVISEIFVIISDKATEIESHLGSETLQSAPETKPTTDDQAKSNVTEPPRPPINLIAPEPEEPKLEAPKPETSPVTLAPNNLPTIAPLAPKPEEEKKPGNLPETFAKPSSYPSGQDPYREPIN